MDSSGMERNVICISRSLAAGGEEIGRLVAAKTGYRYADEEIIVRAAQEVGITPEEMAEEEHTPSLVSRIMSAIAWAPMPLGYIVMPGGIPTTHKLLIGRVVRQIADEGNVVIVAHGGSLALSDPKQALRVLVTASPSVRVDRLVDEGRMDQQEAKKAVDESDRQRAQYLRRFYHVNQELPTHYDVVINTDYVTPERAAQLIVHAG